VFADVVVEGKSTSANTTFKPGVDLERKVGYIDDVGVRTSKLFTVSPPLGRIDSFGVIPSDIIFFDVLVADVVVVTDDGVDRGVGVGRILLTVLEDWVVN